MKKDGNCPTDSKVSPRAFEGRMTVEFFRGADLMHTFDSTQVQGGASSFESHKGDESISITFIPDIEPGNMTYEYSAEEGRFGYASAGRIFPIKGTVKVTASSSMDDLTYELEGAFYDGTRDLTIKGDGYLKYTFP